MTRCNVLLLKLAGSHGTKGPRISKDKKINPLGDWDLTFEIDGNALVRHAGVCMNSGAGRS